MSRLLVHVEGHTEEAFVNQVLQEHLLKKGYSSVSARLMGRARTRQHRGGIRPWSAALQDIVEHLKEDSTCVATTMVDYYGMPRVGNGAWPGRQAAARAIGRAKAIAVEAAIQSEVGQAMGIRFDPRRFIPFVMLHEFEALLFSNCAAFCRRLGRPDLEPQLAAIRSQFETPEDINDSPATAPSKRIEDFIPGYRRQKSLLGPEAASDIGLARIRRECPHFSDWLTVLEGLGG